VSLLVELFTAEFQRHSDLPVTVVPSELLPGSLTAESTTHAPLSGSDRALAVTVWLSPLLLEAPSGVVDYLASWHALWSVQESVEWPTRAHMNRIRSALRESGDYPYSGTAGQAFHAVVRDRLVRKATEHRLTSPGAQWLDLNGDSGVFPSWAGRLLVQQKDVVIWG